LGVDIWNTTKCSAKEEDLTFDDVLISKSDFVLPQYASQEANDLQEVTISSNNIMTNADFDSYMRSVILSLIQPSIIHNVITRNSDEAFNICSYH
jgi:hypothetical protein